MELTENILKYIKYSCSLEGNCYFIFNYFSLDALIPTSISCVFKPMYSQPMSNTVKNFIINNDNVAFDALRFYSMISSNDSCRYDLNTLCIDDLVNCHMLKNNANNFLLQWTWQRHMSNDIHYLSTFSDVLVHETPFLFSSFQSMLKLLSDNFNSDDLSDFIIYKLNINHNYANMQIKDLLNKAMKGHYIFDVIPIDNANNVLYKFEHHIF